MMTGMDAYLIVKTLHILSATVLFGTGMGTAFFMAMSHFTGHIHEKFYAVRTAVLADYIFTVPAVIAQPVTGLALVMMGGFEPMAPWLAWSYALYIVAGLCWLPVVWIQIRLKNILRDCAVSGAALPAEYARLFKRWFMLGWPAFGGLVVVFFLMVGKGA
jgi:uncharacterized membrane protein